MVNESVQSVNKSVLFVLAHRDFRDVEFQKPREILENAGIEITVASKYEGVAVGKEGLEVNVDYDFESHIPVEEFSAVIFVGGPGVEDYFNDTHVHEIARKFAEDGKIVAAICAAPTILVNAGILSGYKATCFADQQFIMAEHNVFYTGRLVERDRNIITANGPGAAEEFGKLILKGVQEN